MKDHTRTEYTVINTAVGIAGYIINTIMGFACRIVFTRCLSADYLGVNGLFTNILQMLSLAELGVGGAVVYALYKPLAVNDEEKIASLVRFYSTAYRVIGVTIAVIGLTVIPFLKLIIHEPPMIHESITLLYLINLFNTASTYFFSYRGSLIIAAQRNYIVASVNYSITIIQSAVQIVFLLLTKNYISYLLIQTVGIILYNVIIYILAGKLFPYIRKKDTPRLPIEERQNIFANIRDLLIYKVSGLLVNSTDNILITFFKGIAVTGIASNYTMLVNMLNTLMSLCFNGLTASVGNYNAVESIEKKYEMFQFLNLLNFWIFGWGALGIIFCSGDLVEWFFGAHYVMPSSIPAIMAINFFSVGMMNAVWTYKHTMGLFHYGRSIQFVTGILNIALSVVFGEIWGIFGILLATLAARLCTNLWYDPYAVFKYGFRLSVRLYIKRLLFYGIVLGVALAICAFCFHWISGPVEVRALTKIALCSIISNLVFFMAFHKMPEFERLKGVFRFVLGRVSRRAQRKK